MVLYYVDTCIWLNLIKKEGDATKGIPYWKIAEDFLSQVKQSEEDKIIYSPIILRELELKLYSETYKESKRILEQALFTRIAYLQEDKERARKLESKYSFSVSFYDLLHLCITKRMGAILITRDSFLIKVAKNEKVKVYKPEELL